MKEIIVFLIGTLLCTCVLVKTIIDEKGIYKLKAVAMWIVLYNVRMILDVNSQFIELSDLDVWFIIIGMILGYVYSFILIMKSRDSWMKLGIIIIWIVIFLSFSATALEIHQMVLLYIFKVLIMLTLLMGLMALRNLPAFGQIIGAIILYGIMIGADVILCGQFWDAWHENQFWSGIYKIVQRDYCLNDIHNQMPDINYITYIADFFICKIMDVILLGFLSARFIEVVSISKSDAAECLK